MSWQSKTFSIRKKLSYLMKSDELSDVTLIVGKEKEYFSTHTWLLSLFSEVFYDMFYAPRAKKEDKLLLPDDDVGAFRIFTKYMYTDVVEINSANEAIISLHFANKYGVTYMKIKSFMYLSNNITSNAVLKIYEAAKLYQNTELKTKCWTYIIANILEIIKRHDIKHVRFNTILSIASEDNLLLESEIDMYNAVVKWGKHNNKNCTPEYLRQRLRKLLHQVRFLTMTSEEFAGRPCKDGILTKDEQRDILKELETSTKCEGNNIDDQWRKSRKEIKEDVDEDNEGYDDEDEEDNEGYDEDEEDNEGYDEDEEDNEGYDEDEEDNEGYDEDEEDNEGYDEDEDDNEGYDDESLEHDANNESMQNIDRITNSTIRLKGFVERNHIVNDADNYEENDDDDDDEDEDEDDDELADEYARMKFEKIVDKWEDRYVDPLCHSKNPRKYKISKYYAKFNNPPLRRFITNYYKNDRFAYDE